MLVLDKVVTAYIFLRYIYEINIRVYNASNSLSIYYFLKY